MEAILAIKGEDFVMMASLAKTENQGLMQEKCILHPLSKYSMMAFRGVTDGDSLNFKKKILRKLTMFQVSHGYSLTPKAAIYFSRTKLARLKRRQPNNQISMMIGGFDPSNGPELQYIDSDGTAVAIPYGVRGSHPEFCDGLLRHQYKPNLNHEGAYMALENCAEKIKKKFPSNTFNFEVFIINNDGIKSFSLGQP